MPSFPTISNTLVCMTSTNRFPRSQGFPSMAIMFKTFGRAAKDWGWLGLAGTCLQDPCSEGGVDLRSDEGFSGSLFVAWCRRLRQRWTVFANPLSQQYLRCLPLV